MTEENLNDVVFDTMWKDKVTEQVAIKHYVGEVCSYSDNAAENAFAVPPFDIFYVNQFMEGRCFEENNASREFFLMDLGLESYNPWEIVRKTHGFLWDDYMWIRFEGETLTWEDVNLGKL